MSTANFAAGRWRSYVRCHLLEVARRGDDLAAAALQGLSDERGDLSRRHGGLASFLASVIM